MKDWRQRFEEQLIFATATVQVGRFRVAATDPAFTSGPRPGHYAVAFPETSVEIRNRDREPFVTDRTVVTLYNPDDVYQRGVRDPRGDRCWWLAMPAAELEKLVKPLRSSSRSSGERLLPFPVAPCTDSAFLFQRMIVGWCSNPATAYEEHVTWAACAAIGEAIRAGFEANARSHREGLAASPSRWLAKQAREVLRQTYRDAATLEEIGARVGCSPYHLCRVFRRQTGVTLHQYRTALRLRAGVDELLARRGDINQVAFALGFASHSHFTDSFRRAFGLTPGQFLRIIDGDRDPATLRRSSSGDALSGGFLV